MVSKQTLIVYFVECLKILSANVLGQKVFEGESNSSKTKINTIQFENGVYIIQVYVDDPVIIKKLQVIK